MELAQSVKCYSFIPDSAPSRNLLRGPLSPDTAKEKCLKKLSERRHVVLGQQAQCKSYI